jgi:hypothetical protein
MKLLKQNHLQETNLLTRVRAVVTASSRADALVYGGSN